MLAATGIAKTYTRGIWPRRKSLQVLGGADLVLRPGEIVGLVGENGSGKSALMKILVGSIDRDGGTITKSGSVGSCPQDPILNERLTCDEHFGLFGKAYGMTGAAIGIARDDIYETLAVRRVEGSTRHPDRCGMLRTGREAGRVSLR